MFSTPTARQAELTARSESIACGSHCEDKHPKHPSEPCKGHAVLHRQGCSREEQTSKQSSKNPTVFNPCVKKPLQATGKAAGQGKLYIHLGKGEHTAPGAIPAPTQLPLLAMALQLYMKLATVTYKALSWP